MAEETDVLDDAGATRLLAMTQLAVAAVEAPGAGAAAKALAHALLGEMSAREPAAERMSVAAAFNREMDAVLDAANASHGARHRATRRVAMAQALDRAGLILVDQNFVAGLFADSLALDVAKAAIARLEEARWMGGGIIAPGGHHHSERVEPANPGVND